MAINTSKVVVGGLAAGVVANIIGFLGFGVLLGPRFEAEAAAVAPALQGRGMTSGAIATNVVATFAVGILLVWLYAAMRPRFGARDEDGYLCGTGRLDMRLSVSPGYAHSGHDHRRHVRDGVDRGPCSGDCVRGRRRNALQGMRRAAVAENGASNHPVRARARDEGALPTAYCLLPTVAGAAACAIARLRIGFSTSRAIAAATMLRTAET